MPLADDEHAEPAHDRDVMADRETSMAIETALATLPPEQRAAVVAVDVEGYSVAEAGKLLGIPVGTVKSRCSRARAKLAHELKYLQPQRNRSDANGV